MTNMEGFGDIGRGVLDNDFLPLARVVGSVFRLTRGSVMAESVNLVKDLANHVLAVNSEVKERFVVYNGLEPFVRLKLKV